jgi:hypothetical protein
VIKSQKGESIDSMIYNTTHQSIDKRVNAMQFPEPPDQSQPRFPPLIENASILTPTSGFLKAGYTHTINVYQGCAFAGSLCGTFCYTQHNRWITKVESA